jgi:hypothetical protein
LGHGDPIDDPMHACHAFAKGHRQLALVKAGYATLQDYIVPPHDYVQFAEAHKMLTGKELLDSVTQFRAGSVVDQEFFRDHGHCFLYGVVERMVRGWPSAGDF